MFLQALESAATLFVLISIGWILYKLKKTEEKYEEIPKIDEIDAIFMAGKLLKNSKDWEVETVELNNVTKEWEIYLRSSINRKVTKHITVHSFTKETTEKTFKNK